MQRYQRGVHGLFRLTVEMPFQKFVEIGRVAVCQDGAAAGKIAAIVDVIDQNRVLLDGPESGVPRQEYRIKNLHLTDLKIPVAFSARTRVVRKAWKEGDINAKWSASSWCKRTERKNAREALTDFGRFKVQKAKSARNKILAKATNTQRRKQKL